MLGGAEWEPEEYCAQSSQHSPLATLKRISAENGSLLHPCHTSGVISGDSPRGFVFPANLWECFQNLGLTLFYLPTPALIHNSHNPNLWTELQLEGLIQKTQG